MEEFQNSTVEAAPTVTPANPNPAPLNKPNNKMLIYAAIIIVILSVIAISFFLYSKTAKKPLQKPVTNVNQANVLAKVGEEFIYKKDLNTEIASYPDIKNFDKKAFLLKKIISDSIILQGTKADGLIALDSTVYNSPNKDYQKRIKLIETAKSAINGKAEGIEGVFVSIWFYNTKSGAVGYEEGKKIAYDKITKLWNDVKSKKITIQQAGEQIKKDTSLRQVDTAYKTNALANFTALKGKKITIDKNFDDTLWKLKEGEVSDVILAKGHDLKTGAELDAFYIFGQVNKVISNSKINSFDDWLSQKTKTYEIIYY
ncbi:hypothetical protein C4559_03790 [Candidatus Microgenomates bacterium]|nr:MAG: hypothetical protein C4559_03790 [Candidatus Microgenomates bacterium]